MKKISVSVMVIIAAVLCAQTSLAAEVRLCPGEREMLAAVLCAECAGEPLAARVAIAGIVLDAADAGCSCLADAVRSVFPQHEILLADGSSDDMRLSLDAVDAALAGCRPAGGATSFDKRLKEKPRLDFADGEEQNGTVIGSYIFK